MRSLISALLLLVGVSATSASHSLASPSVFGVARGGALFGGKKDAKVEEAPVAEAGADAGADAGAEAKKYPALSQEEVEEWLEQVPVFAVTDANGAGVVLKPDNDSSVFYFFFSPQMANATLNQLTSSGAADMDLRVSAFSLGKIWFKILNGDGDSDEVMLKTPGEEGEGVATKNVEYRLVPDTRDLLGARMLLTMNPEDGQKLQEEGGMTQEIAQAAIKKAMTESPKFNTTFNEIPVFMIAQMRMQKTGDEKGEDGEPVTLLPMYFSLQNMVGTWQQFMTQAPADVKDVEPAINLMSLHDLVAMMQKESEIDFRNVVLVPSLPMGADPAQAQAQAEADPMAQMGGSTLGDL